MKYWAKTYFQRYSYACCDVYCLISYLVSNAIKDSRLFYLEGARIVIEATTNYSEDHTNLMCYPNHKGRLYGSVLITVLILL